MVRLGGPSPACRARSLARLIAFRHRRSRQVYSTSTLLLYWCSACAVADRDDKVSGVLLAAGLDSGCSCSQPDQDDIVSCDLDADGVDMPVLADPLLDDADLYHMSSHRRLSSIWSCLLKLRSSWDTRAIVGNARSTRGIV